MQQFSNRFYMHSEMQGW